jgi:hypothetical protein
MRRHVFLVLLLPIAAIGVRTAGAQTPQPVVPIKNTETASASTAKPRDLTKLTPQQRLAYVAGRTGMEWLRRTNKQDGKFVYGFLPDLRMPLDGDNFTAQSGAAFALARAAHYFGDQPSLAISRQALLSLLLETVVDSSDKQSRHTAAPPHVVNRLSGNGYLVLAIHELPAPGQDLLEQAEQLCNYIHRQQLPNGALFVTESGADIKLAASESGLESAGVALHGVLRSQRFRPAPWKLEVGRKARAFAHGAWQEKKSFALAVSHVPAFAEGYLLTHEPPYADEVYALADWLCGLQYEPGDAVPASWTGGFRTWLNGQAVQAAPDIRSAEAAEALGAACRVARAAGDLPRLQRYSRSLDDALQFLQTLQYTEKRTQHFVEAYRPALVGAFHTSAQDGKLRIDYSQHALSALVVYLEQVME